MAPDLQSRRAAMQRDGATREVVVVGGGLAGMAAALGAAQQGFRVSLCEADDHLGGKSGANRIDGSYEDHGYHIFPGWYVNVWALVREIGLESHFVDCNEFTHLVADAGLERITIRNLSSMRNVWHNLTAGLLPPAEMLLFFYANLDLAATRIRDDNLLDCASTNDVIRSRFYATERVVWQIQRMVLRAHAAPSYEIAARTTTRVARYFISYASPSYRILRGNMHQFFIEPFRERLEKEGCRVELGMRLVGFEIKDGRIHQLRFLDESRRERRMPADQVICAIPCEALSTLIDDATYAADPRLALVRKVRTQAVASVHIHFRKTLPDIPRFHVALMDSRFELSLIDVSQEWDELDHTTLNVVASDTSTLQGLSDEAMTRETFRELQRFLPQLREQDVERVQLQRNERAPLFMNDVGNWQYRRPVRTGIENLFLCGDHCRSEVDLATMEGAVETGRRAVNEMLERTGRPDRLPILSPESPPLWRLRLMRRLLAPVAAVAKLWARRDTSGYRIRPPP